MRQALCSSKIGPGNLSPAARRGEQAESPPSVRWHSPPPLPAPGSLSRHAPAKLARRLVPRTAPRTAGRRPERVRQAPPGVSRKVAATRPRPNGSAVTAWHTSLHTAAGQGFGNGITSPARRGTGKDFTSKTACLSCYCFLPASRWLKSAKTALIPILKIVRSPPPQKINMSFESRGQIEVYHRRPSPSATPGRMGNKAVPVLGS